MKKERYNLKSHPKYGRKPDLDPNQKGLLRNGKTYKERKQIGDAFERQLYERLQTAFPDDIVIWDVLFESGNYIDVLKIYESFQMDILVVTSIGVFVIEAKWINNDKYIQVSGGACAKKWKLTTQSGRPKYELNGLKQNYKHASFLKELLSEENINCPVYQMTVIGGLDREKIAVQQFVDANLVDENEMIDRIAYIKNRNETININVKQIANILNDWKCQVEGADILHLVYTRNICKKKIRLPKTCKKIMRDI